MVGGHVELPGGKHQICRFHLRKGRNLSFDFGTAVGTGQILQIVNLLGGVDGMVVFSPTAALVMVMMLLTVVITVMAMVFPAAALVVVMVVLFAAAAVLMVVMLLTVVITVMAMVFPAAALIVVMMVLFPTAALVMVMMVVLFLTAALIVVMVELLTVMISVVGVVNGTAFLPNRGARAVQGHRHIRFQRMNNLFDDWQKLLRVFSCHMELSGGKYQTGGRHLRQFVHLILNFGGTVGTAQMLEIKDLFGHGDSPFCYIYI